MKHYTSKIISAWAGLGPKFLPFADVATDELPLSRLLRLSLFQVSVGMALVLLVGTLNRVMIVELHVPVTLVAVMVALPLLYAPFRALVGFRSDIHRSELGWRRVPYIWMGTMVQFGGLALMPFALLVLSGGGNASHWPAWIGWMGAGLAFLLVGAGLHTTQTAGLALTTDLVPVEAQARVVGLMCVMLLLGTIVSALIFGAFLRDFSPARLVQVIQGSALATIMLNAMALWKQETRRPARFSKAVFDRPQTFVEALQHYLNADGARTRLLAIALGTLAFCMQDVLIEPYGGQVLGMNVGQTTWLTAALAFGGLCGFSLASVVLTRGADPARMAMFGAAVGIPAFAAIMLASLHQSIPIFVVGTACVGFGTGLFSHGNLTLTMNLAPKEQAGLALGAWGAVQATAAGIAVASGGILRDVFSALAARGQLGPNMVDPGAGYSLVYLIEIVLLVATVFVMTWLTYDRLTVSSGVA